MGKQQLPLFNKLQKLKQFTWKLFFFFSILIGAFAITTVWILSSLSIIPSIWAIFISTIVTVLGVLIGLWPLVFSPQKSEPSLITQSESFTSILPQAEVNLYERTNNLYIEDIKIVPEEFIPGLHDTFKEYQLNYIYERTNGKIWIKPEIPYLSLLAKGGPVTEFFPRAFILGEQRLPQLSVKLVNHSPRTILLSEAVVKVISSKIDIEPILLFINAPHDIDKFHNGTLRLFNDGWGKVLNPIIIFTIKGIEDYYTGDLIHINEQAHTLKLRDFFEYQDIPVINYVPKTKNLYSKKDKIYHFSGHILTEGQIQYNTETGETRTIKFNLPVRWWGGGGGAGLGPTESYDLHLKAGRTETKYLPISQVIKPEEAEHFLIRVISDKSAQYTLAFSFHTSDKQEIQSNAEVNLDIFIPRMLSMLIKFHSSSDGEYSDPEDR